VGSKQGVIPTLCASFNHGKVRRDPLPGATTFWGWNGEDPPPGDRFFFGGLTRGVAQLCSVSPSSPDWIT